MKAIIIGETYVSVKFFKNIILFRGSRNSTADNVLTFQTADLGSVLSTLRFTTCDPKERARSKPPTRCGHKTKETFTLFGEERLGN